MARKRKRLNLKFVWIGAGAVVLMAVLATAFVYRHELFYPSPEEYVERGKALMEAGDYEEAGKQFMTAGRLRGGKGDPELYILLGDAWNHLAAESSENFQKARGYWESALSADPRYLPALSRLLQRAEDVVAANPDESSFQYLRETAERMLAVDPENEKAQFLVHRGTLEAWRLTGDTQRTAAMDAVAALEKFLAQHPEHADAMVQIAMAKLNLAQIAFRSNDDAAARRSADEVAALLEKSLAGQDNNAAMHYRAAQVYRELAGMETRLKGDEQKWQDLARKHVETARQLVKPDDEKYRDIQLAYADQLAADDKDAEAENVVKDLMAKYPDDLTIWLALATVIGKDRDRIDEAIEVVTRPLPDVKRKGGTFAIRTKELANVLLLQEIDLRLAKLGTLATADERSQEIGRIDATLAKLQTNVGEAPRVLLTKGRVEIAKRNFVQAIQSLEAALRSPRQRPIDTLQTMAMLSTAYIETDQLGQAKRLLRDMVGRLGDDTPVRYRVLLAQVLLSENNIEEARPHVEVAQKELPADDPDMIKLQILILDKEKDKKQRHELFAKLPEANRQQIFDKARFAIANMREDELGLKLLEALRASDPADLAIVQGLVNYYVGKDKKDQAARVVDDALAKAPEHVGLQMLQKQLAADSPEELRQLREQSVENIADPVRKELRLFELAAQANDMEKARSHLAAAEKLKPEDPTVLEYLYQFHVGQKDFAQAEQYLDRLARRDPGKGEIYRIRLALAQNNPTRALERASQMTRERGEFALAWLMLGEVHRAQGDNMEAINAYTRALERDSRNLEAMRWLIECNYRMNRPGEAKRYIDMATRIYPNNTVLRELQLEHEVRHGDPEQAIAPRQQQLEANKEEPANWLGLGQAYVATATNRQTAAKDADAKSFFQKARETFDAAYAKWPDDQRFAVAVAEVAMRTQNYEDGEKAIRALMARPAWKDRPEPALLLAEYQQVVGKRDEAEKTYRDLLAKTQDLALQLRLADMLFKQDRLDDALAVLQQTNADKPAIRYARVDMLVRGGRTADAQKELDAMMAGQQPGAALLDLQGLVHMQSGRATEAIEAFNKALEQDARFPLALYRRGVVKMLTRGDVEGAINDLTAARQLAPTLPDVRINLANAHRARNDYTAAIRELEDAVRDMPAEKSLRLALVDAYRNAVPPRWGEAERVFREARNVPQLARDPGMLQAEAKMWSDRGDPQRAVTVVQEASKLAPNDLSIAQTFFDVLIKARAYRDVLGASDRMLKSQPNLWWLYHARGRAKAGLNDKDGALVEFEQGLRAANEARDDTAATQIVRSLAQDVGFAAAMNRVESKAQADNRWRNLAMQLCRTEGKFTDALKWAQMMLDDPNLKGPQRDHVLFSAGEVYCNLGQIDKALELYRELAERHPEDPTILNNLAAVMTMEGSPARPEDALVHSQKAYDAMTRKGGMEPAILDTHGWNLVLVGKLDEGILLLQQAAERRPIPDIYFHLGDAYLRKQMPAEAERALRQSKDLIAQAEREKQTVDPSLTRRVEEALLRASAMMQQQKSQASGGGGL